MPLFQKFELASLRNVETTSSGKYFLTYLMNKEFKNQLSSYVTFIKGLISRRLQEEPKRRKNKTKTKMGKCFSFF